MHQDDDPQTKLSKWPFIFGDVLLVATALAIAILGNWQLTDWQVASCVIAVVLGAALFVLPYVVEYYVRVDEGKEGRKADIRAIEKHILSNEQALTSIDTRLRAVESIAARIPEMDDRSRLIESIGENLSHLKTEIESHTDQLSRNEKAVEEISSRKMPDPFDPKLLLSVEERLRVLEERLSAQTKMESEGSAEDTKIVSAAEVSTDPPLRPLVEAPHKSRPKIARPKRAARQRHRPEERRLLSRAINEKQEGSLTAVTRIIESKPKRESNSSPTEAEPQAGPMPEKKSKPGGKGQDSVPKENLLPSVEERKPAAETPQSPPEAAKPKSNITTPEIAESLDLEAEVPAMDSSDMLFDDVSVSSPTKKVRAKKKDAVLTASVFIGIGNKPFVRGSGAGLNWDSGLVMEFQEIGKWRWVAPSHLEGPIEVQLYRNDEEPDKSGKYTINPGEKLDVSPVF